MSWDKVARDYLLPSLQKESHKQPTQSVHTKG